MDPTEESNRFPDDCLPPEGEYGSRDALYKAINEWAAPRGYGFVIARSRVTPSGRANVVFQCDRGAGRTPASSDKRQRQTTTRRTGCHFSVITKESVDRSTWRMSHRSGSGFDTHNHEPSFSQCAHPVHRQLSTIDRSTVCNLANAGVAPKEIRSYLRNNSETQATQQDIYNYLA